MVNPFKKQKDNYGEMIASALDNCRYEGVYSVGKNYPLKMGFTCMITKSGFCAVTLRGARKELTRIRNEFKKAGETKTFEHVDLFEASND